VFALLALPSPMCRSRLVPSHSPHPNQHKLKSQLSLLYLPNVKPQHPLHTFAVSGPGSWSRGGTASRSPLHTFAAICSRQRWWAGWRQQQEGASARDASRRPA